jgi:hypothetical protein
MTLSKSGVSPNNIFLIFLLTITIVENNIQKIDSNVTENGPKMTVRAE